MIKNVLTAGIVLLLVAVACGSGADFQVASAKTCFQLGNLVIEVYESGELILDDLLDFYTSAASRAHDLTGDALASGADMEAALCADLERVLEDVVVEPTFRLIEDGRT